MKISTGFDYNLYLVGLSGTGKSTCGKILSQKLSLTFIDLDKEIIKNEKTSISNIFKNKGEKYFRKIENNILKKYSKKINCIIATGGGIVENYSNIEIMKNTGKIIWLRASPKQISKRLNSKYAEHRPLLGETPKVENIAEMLEKRQHLYNKAEFKIDTNKNSPNEIATTLSKLLQ
jgi:shikimate kinase